MDERYVIAIHESGHAVFNAVFDIPTEYVEITNRRINGVERISGYSPPVLYDDVTKNMDAGEKKRFAVLWLISSAAGIAAEMMSGASDASDQCAADTHQLTCLMAKDANIKIPVSIALQLLEKSPGIKKAHAEIWRQLLTRGRLENGEITRIVDAKMTPDEKNTIKKLIWDYLLK